MAKDRHPPTVLPHDLTRMTLLLFRIRRHLPMLAGEITRRSMWQGGLRQSGALLEKDAPMVVNNITQSQHEVIIVNDRVLALQEPVQICLK
jgi:hypothetical protein